MLISQVNRLNCAIAVTLSVICFACFYCHFRQKKNLHNNSQFGHNQSVVGLTRPEKFFLSVVVTNTIFTPFISRIRYSYRFDLKCDNKRMIEFAHARKFYVQKSVLPTAKKKKTEVKCTISLWLSKE